MKVVALLPQKPLAAVKSRLAPCLDIDERRGLVAAMLADVVAALRAHAECRLVGGADARRLAGELGVGWIDDGDAPDLNTALGTAVQTIRGAGFTTLLVVPADLPTLGAEDVGALFERYAGGLAVCAAARDGGTNALVVSPPDAARFAFGADSARRHLEAGLAAGLVTQRIELEAFAHDIDVPADLAWLCRQRPGPRTAAFITATGLEARLLGLAAVGRSA